MATTRIIDGVVHARADDLKPGMAPVERTAELPRSRTPSFAPVEAVAGPSDSDIAVEARSYPQPDAQQSDRLPVPEHVQPASVAASVEIGVSDAVDVVSLNPAFVAAASPRVIEISMRELFIFGMLFFLTLDAVISWLNRPNPIPTQVGVLSLDRIFERANAHYVNLGQTEQEAQLNTAILYDFVKSEIIEIDAAGQFSAILDSGTVYGGTIFDMSDVVFERALAASLSRAVSSSPSAGGYDASR